MNNQIIEKGLCQCGCGGKTFIPKWNNPSKKWIKGQPIKFIGRHNTRNAFNPKWKGGRRTRCDGYIDIKKPEHPRSDANRYVREHILVAEKALGKPLPKGAVVHHVNENRADNRKENLVICENNAYHKLLHRRLRALKACGHADWRKCTYCKIYNDIKNLFIDRQGRVYHKKCINEYHKQLKARKEQKG